MIAAEAYILASTLRPSLFRIRRIVAVAAMVLAGTLIEKVLFVVEGLQHPHFGLYANVPGGYVPSPIELTSVLGTVAIVTLFFMVVAKVIPVVELHAIEDAREGGEP
nr:hypothetical protein [Halegenticoccus tardaugens]